jgi:hypothetical protein
LLKFVKIVGVQEIAQYICGTITLKHKAMSEINFKEIKVLQYDYSHKSDTSSYYITEAEISGELATEQQLDIINEDKDLVWDLLYKYWY